MKPFFFLFFKDLGQRLREARISHEQLEDVSDFSYGFNKNTLQEFINYWKNDYSWKDEEAKINLFSHFTTQIEGLNVCSILYGLLYYANFNILDTLYSCKTTIK